MNLYSVTVDKQKTYLVEALDLIDCRELMYNTYGTNTIDLQISNLLSYIPSDLTEDPKILYTGVPN